MAEPGGLIKGLLYLSRARTVLASDFEAAFARDDWNIAVRRGQESVEYAVKALHLLGGQVPPVSHDPGLPRGILGRLPVVVFNPGDDPRSSSGVLMFPPGQPWPNATLVKVVNGAYTMLASFSLTTSSASLGVEMGGSTIRIMDGEQQVTAVTDTSVPLAGRWTPIPLTNADWRFINNAARRLAQDREAAFYFDREFTREDAEGTRFLAKGVLERVSRSLGGG